MHGNYSYRSPGELKFDIEHLKASIEEIETNLKWLENITVKDWKLLEKVMGNIQEKSLLGNPIYCRLVNIKGRHVPLGRRQKKIDWKSIV